jgi:redox-sensitive bicupin YhaK (pirin superfamily)
MITLRKAQERFHTRIDWLDSWHTFSFGEHHDPRHMGFGPLRVINDDRIAGGGGFPTHGHRDMEIITIVLEGALAHKDSMGNGSVIMPGDVQKMSAGTGIHHSEFNADPKKPVHLLQIWILPNAHVKPEYQQVRVEPSQTLDRFGLVASGANEKGVISLHQDASIEMAELSAGKSTEYRFGQDRNIWVHVASGALQMNGHTLKEGDGAAVTKETALAFKAESQSQVLLFNMGN